jgi:peptide/nickel transport system substrate-binding protein
VPTGPAISPTLIPPPEIEAPVIYREGLVGRVQRLNPLFAVLNPVDRDISSLIFEGLIGTNQYGEYVPQLAASWLISSDGLEYVFRLRQDVLWQDGQPFAAADVATTIGFLQAPGSALPEDLTAFWRTVELELVDEYTVRFRLAQPLAAFLDYLRIGMLPAHVF